MSFSPKAGSTTVTIGGPAPVTLSENSEAHEALDVILSQVFNKDASACISALSQLDEFIKDDEKVSLLGSRMDQLLTACYMQYRHVLNNKMRTDNAASNAKEVSLFNIHRMLKWEICESLIFFVQESFFVCLLHYTSNFFAHFLNP
jgi:hypothetical protein